MKCITKKKIIKIMNTMLSLMLFNAILQDLEVTRVNVLHVLITRKESAGDE